MYIYIYLCVCVRVWFIISVITSVMIIGYNYLLFIIFVFTIFTMITIIWHQYKDHGETQECSLKMRARSAVTMF